MIQLEFDNFPVITGLNFSITSLFSVDTLS